MTTAFEERELPLRASATRAEGDNRDTLDRLPDDCERLLCHAPTISRGIQNACEFSCGHRSICQIIEVNAFGRLLACLDPNDGDIDVTVSRLPIVAIQREFSPIGR
jgi:hypothetical protein